MQIGLLPMSLLVQWRQQDAVRCGAMASSQASQDNDGTDAGVDGGALTAGAARFIAGTALQLVRQARIEDLLCSMPCRSASTR